MRPAAGQRLGTGWTALRDRRLHRIRFEVLEARTLLATVNWAATSSGNWDVGSNWSTGQVPGPGDDVVINPSNALTVTINSGNQSVNSLESASNATLSLTGGSLAVAAGAEVDGGFQVSGNVALAGTFTGGSGSAAQLSSGTLTGGSGGATLDFPVLQWTGGNLGGTVANAGMLTVSGSAVLLAGTLTNTGTIDVAGADTIYAAASGAMIDNQAGGTFDFQADGSLSTSGYGGTAFNNSGTLEKTAGSGTTTVNFPLDNTGGTVAITSAGTLNFSGGGTFSGTMTVSGTVNISYGTFTAAAGSTISSPSGGTGDLEVSGNGTLSLGGSLSTNIVTIAGGMLTGSGTIASGTQTTWSSGEVDGSLTNAGTLTVSGSILVLAGTLTNTGTIDVAGADTIYAAASGAMIDNQAGGTFDFPVRRIVEHQWLRRHRVQQLRDAGENRGFWNDHR